ncbi:MAG: SGNH/GDSL hydrolase family protein [Clostridia bacterium]|nr:SGNH/GDSL hydrolase family protein [Clostridia bacterium]
MKTGIEAWRGRRVAFIGDSITEGVGSDRAYHEYLAEWLGIEAYNYGVNGAQTDFMLELAKRLEKEHPDVDAVFVFGGTNDFNHGLPMGEFFTAAPGEVNHNGRTVTRLHRAPVMDEGTFCGRLNRLLGEIKRGFPKAQVIVMTPIHRGYAVFSEENVQPDEYWANEQGLFIGDYAEAVRRAARLWAAPVIDLYSDSGLLPALGEYAPFFHDAGTDNLHPNARGHERIARVIAAALNAIPAAV